MVWHEAMLCGVRRGHMSAELLVEEGDLAITQPQAARSKVFSEVARLLKSGGRFAISDIVTEVQLPETIVCNSTLWAACIGGAAQQDNYRGQIAAAGMKVVKVQDNPTYQFISDNARGASKKFGVKSISLLAVKP